MAPYRKNASLCLHDDFDPLQAVFQMLWLNNLVSRLVLEAISISPFFSSCLFVLVQTTNIGSSFGISNLDLFGTLKRDFAAHQ